jgi:hypothetical protein
MEQEDKPSEPKNGIIGISEFYMKQKKHTFGSQKSENEHYSL